MPLEAWSEVSGDFHGPLADGTYWFVNHFDYYRWASVDVIKSCSFESVKTVLFSTFGLSQVYKTDNGLPFQSY